MLTLNIYLLTTKGERCAQKVKIDLNLDTNLPWRWSTATVFIDSYDSIRLIDKIEYVQFT